MSRHPEIHNRKRKKQFGSVFLDVVVSKVMEYRLSKRKTTIKWLIVLGLSVAVFMNMLLSWAFGYYRFPSTSSPAPSSSILSRINTPPRIQLPPSIEERAEHDSSECPGWSLKDVFFPNDYNKLQLGLVNNTGVGVAHWKGSFSTSIYFPYEQQCFENTKHLKQQHLNDTISISSSLCKQNSNVLALYNVSSIQNEIQSQRSTIVLQVRPEINYWLDLINDNMLTGLHIYHFHAQFLPIWLGIRLIDVTFYLLSSSQTHHQQYNITKNRNKLSVLPSTLNPIVDVVFLFPDELWHRFKPKNIHDKTPILLDSSTVHDIISQHGSSETSLIGLQTVQDTLKGGKLIIGSSSSSLRSVYDTLSENNLNLDISAWMLSPSRDEFLPKLTSFDYSSKSRFLCKHTTNNYNVLQYYSNALLNSYKITHPSKIARHICLVSRQIREKQQKHIQKQPLLRNLNPTIFSNLMKGLALVVVLTPNQALHSSNSEDQQYDGYPLNLDQSSVTDQLRYVHDECAVLVGVHGAGLTNMIGLRSGTHVVEFQGRFKHTLYKNMAFLLDNVSHSIINFNSEVMDEKNFKERNFSLPEEELNNVVEFIQDKLQDSLRTQRLFLKQKNL